MSTPKISVVVIVHDMAPQAMNTLRSLTPGYQEGVSEDDYEVIVVENRSRRVLDPAAVAALPGRFRYVLRDEAGVSPAPAINFGVAQARGEVVCLMIDGARLLSPGVLRHALMAYRMLPEAVVAVPGYQIGPRPQDDDPGHTEETDRELLHRIGWPGSGYRIFEIASMSLANRGGTMRPFMECNCLFLPAATLAGIGGAHEGFDLPGGGALNLWIYHRALDRPGAQLVVLHGEGSFHQFHGGVTTAARPRREALIDDIKRQLEAVLGRPFKAPSVEPVFLGHLPFEAFPFVDFSAQRFVRNAQRQTAASRAQAGVRPEPPLLPNSPEAAARAAASPKAGAAMPARPSQPPPTEKDAAMASPYLPPSLQSFRSLHMVFSTWVDHVPFGYDLVAALRPKLLVELGTQRGMSYFTFCQAMKENGIDGLAYAVDTWEGDAHTKGYDETTFKAVAQHNRAHYHGFSYLLRMLFSDALRHFSDESIDLLHIDGLHTYEAVEEDFRTWYPKVRPGGIVLFHDIRARLLDFGAWRFWDELERGHECFAFNHGFGLGVLRKPGGDRSADPELLRLLFEGARADGGAALRAFYVHASKHHDFLRQAARGQAAKPAEAVPAAKAD